jgi:hypothetical protein
MQLSTTNGCSFVGTKVRFDQVGDCSVVDISSIVRYLNVGAYLGTGEAHLKVEVYKALASGAWKNADDIFLSPCS